MVYITLPENYGAPVAVAIGAIPLLSWMQGNIVTVLRKDAKVPYPHHYATVEQCKENPTAYRFNCAQRAHGNLLENMPQTMLYILIAGLKWPTASAGLGLGWIVFRSLFAYGYIKSSKPNGNGRFNGAACWLCQAALWGMAVFGVARELGIF